ncbi:MAG: hypothetical protein ACTSUH_08815, partial [Candidatus Thorarchaeota archaeon]
PNASFDHDDGSPEELKRLEQLLSGVERRLSEEGTHENLRELAPRILNIIVYTHDSRNRAVATRRRNQVGPIDPLAQVIRLGDGIASIKNPAAILRADRDLDIPQDKDVSFEYHEISAVRGLTSSLLNEALIHLMEESGYRPLLHFGTGTIYMVIGEPKPPEDPQGRLNELLDEQVDRFRESEAFKTGMTNAVIGLITQNPWPVIQLVRDTDIPDIIYHLSSQPAMNKKREQGQAIAEKAENEKDADKRTRNVRAIEEFVRKTGSDKDEIIALMTSDFNLFVYVATFLKKYGEFAVAAGMEKEYVTRVDQLLAKHLPGLSMNEIKDVGNTTPIHRRLEVVSVLWDLDSKKLHLSKNRRETLVQKFIEVMKPVPREFRQCAPRLFTDEARRLLLADIRHIPLRLLNDAEIREMTSLPYARYLGGKEQTKRICSFCGAEGIETAPAGLFGGGSEMFSNFIAAGVSIGGEKKAQVCALCKLEATLRAFFFPQAPAATLIVTPDLSLGPELARLWAEGVESFAKTERLGLSASIIWNMNDVYQALAKGETVNNAAQLASMLSPTKRSVNDLAKYLEETVSDPSKLRFARPPVDSVDTSFKAIAEAHLRGLLEIHPRHLDGYSAPSRAQGTAYMTPNHMFIFLRDPPRTDKEESDSSVAIRLLTLSLIIAMAFHARVIVQEGFKPVTDLAVEGAAKMTLPPPAGVALSNLRIADEVGLEELRSALQKLSALTLIAMWHVEKLGKDRLLRLASMNRGAILRRSQMEDPQKFRKRVRRLMKLLEVLPDFAEPAS